MTAGNRLGAGAPAFAGVMVVRCPAVRPTTWIGARLTLPFYGAEDFGLHAIAGPARRICSA